MSNNPPQQSRSTEPYRERLSAEVDGLRRQVEELRQHVRQGEHPPQQRPHYNPAAVAAQMQQQQQHSQHNLFAYGAGAPRSLAAQAQLSQQQRQQQQQQHMSQQGQQQQQHEQHRRANLLASLPPSLLAGGNVVGNNPTIDNYAVIPQSGQTHLGLRKEDITNMLRGKQHSRAAQLANIMEERRKLHDDLDTLERQRMQIIGESGAANTPNQQHRLLHEMQERYQSQQQQQQQQGAQSSQSQLRLPHSGGGSNHPGLGNFGGGHVVPPSIIAGARDALHRYPSAMPYPGSGDMEAMAAGRNRSLSKTESQLLEQQSSFPRGYSGSPTSPRGAASLATGVEESSLGRLKRARSDYDTALAGATRERLSEQQEMEREVLARRSSARNDIAATDPGGGDSFNDKRRRMMAESALREEMQKRHMDTISGMSASATLSKPNYGMGRGMGMGMGMSSLFPPNEILLGGEPGTTDSLGALSSSHRLLVSQREAQSLLFYGQQNRTNQGGTGATTSPSLQQQQHNSGGLLDPLQQHDRKLPETKQKLPKTFVPEVDTVVLGKGNIPKNNYGNLKLKGIVMDGLVEYANGERRKKISVISKIIRCVTARNYSTTGFVKYEDDSWWEMTERDARVKITALFRDCLHDQYRSSSSSKVKRRQELRKREITGGGSPTAGDSPTGGSRSSQAGSEHEEDEEGNGTQTTK